MNDMARIFILYNIYKDKIHKKKCNNKLSIRLSYFIPDEDISSHITESLKLFF